MAKIDDLTKIDEISDLDSNFDAKETKDKKRKIDEIDRKVRFDSSTRMKPREERIEEASRARFRSSFMGMTAFERHKRLVNDYVRFYSKEKSFDEIFKRDNSKDMKDLDVIRSEHRFLWDDDEDAPEQTWEKRLAKKYYDKLFKEYCICDLSRWEEKKIAMRWRIDREVVTGKGQFSCAEKRCEEKEHLRTWEVLFSYVEHGRKREALVKLRLCQSCTKKLHFGHKVKEFLPKTVEPNETPEQDETSAETKKKSRLDDDDNDDSALLDDGKIWSKPLPETHENNREEEFDEYLQTLFF